MQGNVSKLQVQHDQVKLFINRDLCSSLTLQKTIRGRPLENLVGEPFCQNWSGPTLMKVQLMANKKNMSGEKKKNILISIHLPINKNPQLPSFFSDSLQIQFG